MTEEGESGPAEEVKDCREGSGGFDGDPRLLRRYPQISPTGGLRHNAAVVYGGKSGESGGWEDGAGGGGGDEKPTFPQ